MRRLVLLALLAVATPGCLAAALVGGTAYVIGKNTESEGEERTARMDYLARARERGLTDEQILQEIKVTDPAWYEELVDSGSGLPQDRPLAAAADPDDSE
ncbi:MAG: hypothetical protein OER88_00120 [Planctomycetota bacterium]|nr:hypothetical protein [Planctomycetota bacterium]